MQKTVAILRLIRPINCVIMGLAVFVGMIVATRGQFSEATMIIRIPLGFVTGFTFLGAANTVNDYHDRNIDKVNEPNRPIPSGAVSPKEALGYAAVLSVIGFLAAFFTRDANLAVAIIAWFLFVYYATKGKRTGILGNLIVSVCTAIPFIYGGLAVEKELSPLLILFASMAFSSTVGREVTKGIVDVHGDQLQGVKTVAVLYGPKNAAKMAETFYIIAVALSILPLLMSPVSVWYLPLVTLADIGFLASTASLARNHSRDNARRVKNLARVWMVIGLLAFVAGSLLFGEWKLTFKTSRIDFQKTPPYEFFFAVDAPQCY